MNRSTPYLVIDVDRLDANIAAMAAHARALGVDLRPHCKTHKTVEIARRQLAAGAVGITVATVGEAEVLVASGATDVFIAFPIWANHARATRLYALAQRVQLTVGVDSVESVALLAAAVRAGQSDAARLAVAVEVDSGHHRSGVASPEHVVQIAKAACSAGLVLGGLFTFPGHSYAQGAGESASRNEADALARARDALLAAGLSCPVLSGGSTPSAGSLDGAVVTEMRPGVYVFGDAQQLELGSIALSAIALTARATVVSRRGNIAIVDAGSKILGADRPAYASGFGRLKLFPEARITALSEHHATIVFQSEAPALGTEIEVIPNHSCNAVNLVDELVVERNGAEIDVWRVAARGCNS